MNVSEFKRKIAELEKETGWKWKIHYKGYKEALENNRLLPWWHKECRLATVTTPNGPVSFNIVGKFVGTVYENESEVRKIDGILDVDGDDEKSQRLIGMMDDIYIIEEQEPVLMATFGENTRELAFGPITDPIFDIDLISEIIGHVPEEKPEKSPEKKPEKVAEKATEKDPAEKPVIKDSGQRTEFKSGAVRDVQEGKGRCDLLPLDMVSEFFETEADKPELEEISLFQETRDYHHLLKAAKKFSAANFENDETAILEYAIHLEEGAKKYSDRNWEKGIPLDRFVDSGVRHWLKHRRGDNDEPHDRAFLWNMICGAWTVKHHGDIKA